ncbi:MAG: sigma-70 family RNA polymerase sigma factor [Planctomycetota bacterium]
MAHTTRQSLLVRIKDGDDQVAWERFIEIYGPLIFRFGMKKGLQEADAADLTQDVLQRISQSIARFEYDPSLGRFRSWLFLIASQSISKLLEKKERQPVGSGDSAVAQSLHQIPSREEENVWETEYRQHVLDWAKDQIRDQFANNTWLAFVGTAIENKNAQAVADELGMSVGAVYVARSRVMKRLKEVVATIDESME